MTIAFFVGIVAYDCWKTGLTFISSVDRRLLTPRICRPSARQRAARGVNTEASGDFLSCNNALESPRQLFALFVNLPWQARAEFAEKLLRIFHFRIPIFGVHTQQFAQRFV